MPDMIERIPCIDAQLSNETGDLSIRALGALDPDQQQAIQDELTRGELKHLSLELQVDRQQLELAQSDRWIRIVAQVVEGLRGLETVFLFKVDPEKRLFEWKSRDKKRKEELRARQSVTT